MSLKKLLRVFPIMLAAALLGIGAITAPITAQGTISPISGPVNSTIAITFIGTGFTQGNTYSVIFSQGSNTWTATGSVTATSTTTISGSVTVPAAPVGQHTILLRRTGETDKTAGTFTVTPAISLNTSTAPPGTTINVTGTGFVRNSTVNAVNIYFSAFTAAIVTATTDANGSFTAPFVVPQVGRGQYNVTANDGTNSAGPLAFNVIPRIATLSAETGGVGDTITVTGEGFTAFGSVSVLFDSTTLVTVTANSNGAISTTITIPAAARGIHSIVGRDNTSTAIDSASRTFTINQSRITLSPSSGPVGTSLVITGTGFTASTTVDFEFDNAAFAGTTSAPTNTTGGFTKTGVIIPTVTAGPHTITARVSGDSVVFGEATFAVQARIILTPSSGTAGQLVTVTGSGFYPNAAIVMAYDALSLPLAPGNVLSLPNGTFTAQFTVPGAAAGVHTVTAADGLGNVVTATFTSVITATISPETSEASPGFVGQDLTVMGTGFVPNGTVTFKFGTETKATVTATATGGFTATFKAPAVAKGNHTITVADSITTRTFTYVMEGNAPAAPALSAPPTTPKPKQPVTFQWGSVSDPSGVKYTLEIATDANFSNVVLRKTGLTETSYTMTEAEKLPTVPQKTPYYWRVTATDGAGNVSAPSTARTFAVGFSLQDVPMWAWITIGFFAIVIIIGIVYLATRRRSL